MKTLLRYLLPFALAWTVFAQSTPTVQVDTWAALKALTIPIVPGKLTVLVKGRVTVNDQGGGIFTYNANGGTDDGGTIAAALDGKAFYREYDQAQGLNVKWFGAVDDGVTDNLTAFNLAKAAAISGGAGLFIPTGTFALSGTFTLDKAIPVTGNGVIKELSVLAPVINITSSGASVSGISILGIETVGTWDNTLAQLRVGITVAIGAQDVKIFGVSCFNKSTGIKTLAARSTITSCIVSNSWLTAAQTNYFLSSGILAIVDLAEPDGGTISYNKTFGHGQGILEGNSSRAINIIGNIVRSSVNNGIYLSSGLRCVVQGNAVFGQPDNGIKLRGNQNLCTENTINGGNIGVVVSAIDLQPSAGTIEKAYSDAQGITFNGFGTIVANNAITSSTVNGIRIDRLSTAIYCHDTVVSDNTLQECGLGGSQSILVLGGHGHIISGNRIFGTNAITHGIQITAGGFDRLNTLTIDHNHINNMNAIQGIGIDSCDNIRVEHNIVDPPTSNFAIFFNGCTYPSASYNVCTNGTIRFDTLASTNITVSYNSVLGISFPTAPVSGTVSFNYASSLDLSATNTLLYVGNSRSDSDSIVIGARKHYFGTQVPVSGTWTRGDVVYNQSVSDGGTWAWTCVTGGTPGTWVAIPVSSSGTITGSLTTGAIPYATSATALGSGPLMRLDANTLEQRNGANAQTLNVYGTYTDAANYTRMSLVGGANFFRLTANNLGSGAVSDLYLTSGKSLYLGVDGGAVWNLLTSTKELQPQNDASYQLGDATHRVKYGFFGGSTETSSNPVITEDQTWNSGGVTFNEHAFRVTDTASAAASTFWTAELPAGTILASLRKDGTFNASAGSASRVSYSLGSQDGSGMYLRSLVPVIAATGGDVVLLSASGISIRNNIPIGWGTLNVPTVANLDATISRIAPGVIGVGTGAQGSTAGTLQASRLISGVDAAGTKGATWTLDTTLGDLHTATSTASTAMTITPSSAGTAGQVLSIILTSDATGGDVITFASTFKSAGTMTLTASKGHTISFVSDGSNWYETSRATNL